MCADRRAAHVPDDLAPDDFSMRLVAIVNVGPGDNDGLISDPMRSDVAVLLAHHGGQLVENRPEGILATFHQLSAATAFAHELQPQLTAGPEPWPRIGINLGRFAYRRDGRPGRDVVYAAILRLRAGPGEIHVPAVATNKLSSRVRPDGCNEPPGWRVCVLPAVGLVCFLGYNFGWFYAIYWKIAYYVSNHQFPCWPEWLCR